MFDLELVWPNVTLQRVQSLTVSSDTLHNERSTTVRRMTVFPYFDDRGSGHPPWVRPGCESPYNL